MPLEVVLYAVALRAQMQLSYRDVQAHLKSRGVTVSHEAIRNWTATSNGEVSALGLSRDIASVECRAMKVTSELRYLWLARDEQGAILDLLIQRQRNDAEAAQQVRKGVAQLADLARQRAASPFRTSDSGAG